MIDGRSYRDVLEGFIVRSLYSSGQLSKLTGVPLETIKNWRSGKVQRPRNWHDIVNIARALHLQKHELDTLLLAAGHPVIGALLKTIGTVQERQSLVPWGGQPD